MNSPIKCLKYVGMTPLQILQKKYWQDLGTCARVRMNIEKLPDADFKNEARLYVARAKRVVEQTYLEESAKLKEEMRVAE